MTNIFVDPFLFACPRLDEGEEIFQAYISDLLEWKDLNDCKWANIFILRETHTILAEQNNYPLWDDLKRFIRKYEIDYIQPDAIVTLVNSFLDKFAHIESSLEIVDILPDKIITEPTDHLRNRTQIYSDIYCKTLIYMSLKTQLCNEKNTEQLIITTGIEKNTNLKIIAELNFIEFENEAENNMKITCPLQIREEFTGSKNYEGLLLAINPILMWMNSDNNQSYIMSIIINNFILNQDLDLRIRLTDLANFELCKGFIPSVKGHGFNHIEEKIKALLRSISELILGINFHKSHALRMGRGGNDPQIEVNNYKAWRRDIDYDYHLHYWTHRDKFKLSCIVLHNDFSIKFD